MRRWTLQDIPDLDGRTALVTGGNVGLGFRSTLELARKGARVMIACRSTDRGEAAARRIRSELPAARVDVVALDLAEPANIEHCAGRVSILTDRLDVLLNNAGVVSHQYHKRTTAGHEMHLATNHYGHFLLTGRLFPLLAATAGARVITVTSGGYRYGALDFDDLDWRKRPYHPVRSYGASKLANLLFTRELQKRFDSAGAVALSLAAHPGLTGTERQQSTGGGGLVFRLLASSVDVGVCPQLRAATDPTAGKGYFYGPRFGIYGPPRRIAPVEGPATSDALASRLWNITEEITGFSYPANPETAGSGR
ncbi:MAG: oxidoreductase [Rhodospirillales bacterium]|nr:oxidoreductase [Rhodospirillales bacterium]